MLISGRKYTLQCFQSIKKMNLQGVVKNFYKLNNCPDSFHRSPYFTDIRCSIIRGFRCRSDRVGLRYVLQTVWLPVHRWDLFGFFLYFLLLVAVVVLTSKAAEPDGANSNGKQGEDGETNGQPDNPKPGGGRRLVKGL